MEPTVANNKAAATSTPHVFTVLFVDDETSILRSIKRLFHKSNINILLAQSGKEALEMFANHDIAMIVSDMKMPHMTGAELLAQVADLYPDVYRVVLTGFADLDSIMTAVNQGGIHRYLQKPWDNQELVLAVKDGLKYTKLKQENIRLQQTLVKQNRALKELTHSLDKKVNVRTKQIQAAMHKLKREYAAAEKVLFNCISVHPELDGEFAQLVGKLAVELAEKMALSKDQIRDIQQAALLCQIGLIGKEVHLFNTAFNDLNYEQQKAYVRQVDIATMMLSPLTHMQSVIDIIEHQFEYYNGQGYPEMLVGETIPVGARILFIARDFWRYRVGKVSIKHYEAYEARQEMNMHRGTKYDPAILDHFNELSLDYEEVPDDGSISVGELKPGMILEADIYNQKYVLMLPQGHTFTEATINKLKQYENNHKERLRVFVMDEEPVEASPA